MTATQPQSISLSDAEFKDTFDHTTETKRLLQHAFDHGSAKQQSDLIPTLMNLQQLITLYELISAIRQGLKNTTSLDNWLPRGHPAKILEACCNQRYLEDDLEYIFYKDGGINGLLVFHLGTKGQTTLFTKTLALPRERIVELAKMCKKEQINALIEKWIGKYKMTKSTTAFFVP
jgi:hypothetical protein